MPASTLKNVVLPAPLGPMRLMMAPLGMLRSVGLTASNPPNRLVMPLASSSSSGPSACTLIRLPRGRGGPSDRVPRYRRREHHPSYAAPGHVAGWGTAPRDAAAS